LSSESVSKQVIRSEPVFLSLELEEENGMIVECMELKAERTAELADYLQGKCPTNVCHHLLVLAMLS
jgi:hypothetical protein